MTCNETILTGPRRGQSCGLQVSEVVSTGIYLIRVCGYHARAWAPRVRYPLWANLAQLRRLQMANLDALESRTLISATETPG